MLVKGLKGFKVGNRVRAPTSAKVEKIRKLPTPTCKKDLDQLLGIFGQYRSLIKDFAAKAQCLYELKKKSVSGNSSGQPNTRQLSAS